MPPMSDRLDSISRPGRCSVGMRAACLVTVAIVTLNGCATLRPQWMRPKVACVLPPNPTKEQVVQHINANVDRVQAYKANSLRIRANGMPLNGHLVVERGHRLRLQVASLIGPEVDLGSNDEVFWIWAKRNEPAAVYYASHSEMDVARQNLPIPFEPEWLMEALGVAPLAAEAMDMEVRPGGTIQLASQHQMPSGDHIRKVVVVDPCKGQIIEHSTYNAQGQPLVRVLLQDHRPDVASGAMLARHIKLIWPQAEMSLAMDLGEIEVNPASISPSIWAMYSPPGYPVVDLGRRLDRNPAYQRPSETLIAQPGKARISDDAGMSARPAFDKIAFGVTNDDFRAPEVTDRNGPVVLEEPINFEPPAFDQGPHPTATIVAPF